MPPICKTADGAFCPTTVWPCSSLIDKAISATPDRKVVTAVTVKRPFRRDVVLLGRELPAAGESSATTRSAGPRRATITKKPAIRNVVAAIAAAINLIAMPFMLRTHLAKE